MFDAACLASQSNGLPLVWVRMVDLLHPVSSGIYVRPPCRGRDRLQDLIRDDRRRSKWGDFDPSELKDCASWLEEALADIPVGRTVVYLDGRYFDVDAEPGAFEGDYAAHEFQHLPHFVALTNPAHLDATLGERSYWLARALPEPANTH